MAGENGNITYHDYLIERGKMYKKKHEDEAHKRNTNATDGCTFKPDILKKKPKTANNKKSDMDKLNKAMDEERHKRTNGNKWEELYLQAERKKKKDKSDRRADEIEFEKN